MRAGLLGSLALIVMTLAVYWQEWVTTNCDGTD